MDERCADKLYTCDAGEGDGKGRSGGGGGSTVVVAQSGSSEIKAYNASTL